MTARPSVRDVARHAGVSVGTVSHVLNHPDRVASATRERVERVIAELGFVRSTAARQLRDGASSTVGLVLHDIANPFYTEAARAVEDHLVERGYALLLCSTDGEQQREARALRMLLEQDVAGVIVTPSASTDANLGDLRRRRTPVVLLDSPGDVPDLPSVGVDDLAGGRIAVSHLLARGHRSIVVLLGPMSVRQARQRWAGACAGAREAGFDVDAVLRPVECDAFSADAAAGAMRLVLTEPRRPTAVFAGNDIMAIGAMRVIRKAGLRIPDDIAVVGYDDVFVSAELVTPLTSVRQPLRDLGRTAAELVLRRIADGGEGEPQHVVFRPELVVRDSTGGRD